MGIDIRVVYQWLFKWWVISSIAVWIVVGGLYVSNRLVYLVLYKWWVIASAVLWGIFGLAYLAMRYHAAHPEPVMVSKVGYMSNKVWWFAGGWFLHDLWRSPNHGLNVTVIGTFMILMILWFLFVTLLTRIGWLKEVHPKP